VKNSRRLASGKSVMTTKTAPSLPVDVIRRLKTESVLVSRAVLADIHCQIQVVCGSAIVCRIVLLQQSADYDREGARQLQCWVNELKRVISRISQLSNPRKSSPAKKDRLGNTSSRRKPGQGNVVRIARYRLRELANHLSLVKDSVLQCCAVLEKQNADYDADVAMQLHFTSLILQRLAVRLAAIANARSSKDT